MSKESAYNHVVNRLKYSGLLKNYELLNKKRHMILWTGLEEPFDKIYMVYHRELFNTFPLKFYHSFIRYNEEYRFSKGESINKNCLDIAIKEECVVVFIYPDKKMRWVYPMVIKKFAEKWKLINRQDKYSIYRKNDYSGYYEGINELTYSIPTELLKKFDMDLLLN